MPSSRDLAFFIRGQARGLPSNTRGRSPVPELGTPGSVRGGSVMSIPTAIPRGTAKVSIRGLHCAARLFGSTSLATK